VYGTVPSPPSDVNRLRHQSLLEGSAFSPQPALNRTSSGVPEAEPEAEAAMAWHGRCMEKQQREVGHGEDRIIGS
jgi:hypothetical protein